MLLWFLKNAKLSPFLSSIASLYLKYFLFLLRLFILLQISGNGLAPYICMEPSSVFSEFAIHTCKRSVLGSAQVPRCLIPGAGKSRWYGGNPRADVHGGVVVNRHRWGSRSVVISSVPSFHVCSNYRLASDNCLGCCLTIHPFHLPCISIHFGLMSA